MTKKKPPADANGRGEKQQQRRSRSRQPGSIQAYDTDQGKRWRFQIYVLKDPEYPEMGSRRLTRSGFTSTDEANDALQEALKQRKQNEKFGNKVPTVGVYADEWVAGLKLAASTIENHPKLYKQFYSRRDFTWGKTLGSGADITQANRDPLLGRVAGADGLKTGHTEEAGYGFTGSAEQGGRRLVMVVAGLTSFNQRAQESVRFMEWGFRAWQAKPVVKGSFSSPDCTR